MHFMGTTGMPRRISDYPDSFSGLNHIASLGSMISVAASLLFFYLILDALLQQKRSAAYAPWSASTSRQAAPRVPTPPPTTGVTKEDIIVFIVLALAGYVIGRI